MDLKAWLRSTAKSPVCDTNVSLATAAGTFSHRTSAKRHKRNYLTSEVPISRSYGTADQSGPQRLRHDGEEATALPGDSASGTENESSLSIFGPNESFEKRKRSKTRSQLFLPHTAKTKQGRKHKEGRSPRRQIRYQRTERTRKLGRRGNQTIKNFCAQNVGKSRLTLKQAPKIGLFNRGRASAPEVCRGLPDLVFSEMHFLSNQIQKSPLAVRSGSRGQNERCQRTEGRRRDEEISIFYSGMEPTGGKQNFGAFSETRQSPQGHLALVDDMQQLGDHVKNDASESSSSQCGVSQLLPNSSGYTNPIINTVLEPRGRFLHQSAVVGVGQLGRPQRVEHRSANSVSKAHLLVEAGNSYCEAVKMGSACSPNGATHLVVTQPGQRPPHVPLAYENSTKLSEQAESSTQNTCKISKLLQGCNEVVRAVQEQILEEESRFGTHGQLSFVHSRMQRSDFQRVDGQSLNSRAQAGTELGITQSEYMENQERYERHEDDDIVVDENTLASQARYGCLWTGQNQTPLVVLGYLTQSTQAPMQPGDEDTEMRQSSHERLSNCEKEGSASSPAPEVAQSWHPIEYSNNHCQDAISAEEERTCRCSRCLSDDHEMLSCAAEHRSWLVKDDRAADERGSAGPLEFWRPNRLY